MSSEWRSLIPSCGITDIKTCVALPQPNGVVEWLYRIHREEAGLLEDTGYHAALEQFERWAQHYNHRRPHSALEYPCPIDYYRGDPQSRLAERKSKLEAALTARIAHWSTAQS